MALNHESQGDCGLEGADDQPVATGRFNRWVAIAVRHHVGPMKAELTATRAELTQHVINDRIMQAQILGGIKVLTWILPVLVVAVPAIVLYIMYLLHKSGAL